MPFPLYLALLTLAPAGCAVLIAAVGIASRAGAGGTVLRLLTLGLAVLGALIAAAGVLLYLPASQVNGALFVTLFGGSISQQAWFSAAYRIDGLGLYAALGIALIVAPLLLWMAWQHGSPPSGEALADEADDEAVQDQESAESLDVPSELADEGQTLPQERTLPTALWGGLALALAAESAALTLVFSDNILWMALAWGVLAALAWGLGEIGNPPDTLDWPGLALMLAGPVLWTVIFFIPAFGGQGGTIVYPRLTDMMGRGTITPLHALGMALALALAAGAYPFLAWVRGRAALITPAGLAALALAVMPAALFVGARLYSAAENSSGAWQQIGQAAPPITGGIFFTLIGAVTVGIAGLMALERRDSRALIAYVAVAQAGWGLVALGSGAPAGIVGLVVLLATSTFGLGAMLAAIYAAGALTSDLEPDAAGPRAFGAPADPLRLAAWSIGALTVVGAPLGAGFVGRQLIAAGALEGGGLLVPLTALAWAGDVLLGLALLRATAPAFSGLLRFDGLALGARHTSEAESNAVLVGDEDNEEVFAAEAGSEEDDETVTIDDGEAAAATASTAARTLALLSEVPAAALALLAVIVAVVPQVLLRFGAIPALGALVPPGLVNTVAPSQLGYSFGGVAVLPALAWGAFAVFFVLRVLLVPSGTRQARPVTLVGAAPAVENEATVAAETTSEHPHELEGMPEPVDAWADLDLAFRSAWTLPGAEWLVRSVEDEPELAAEEEIEPEHEPAAEEEASPSEPEAAEATAVENAAPRDKNPSESGTQSQPAQRSRAPSPPATKGTAKSPSDSSGRAAQSTAKSRKPGRTGDRP